jgi:Flp pilus assembly protein TadD
MAKQNQNRLIATMMRDGLAHHRAGRLGKASDQYARILKSDAGNADALNLSGIVARQQGDLVLSRTLITQAIQCNPLAATYHYNLGRTYELQGLVDEAGRSYRRAL